ncbi:MAG: 3-phosphoshikimate 1-carboxyvinyltransferase [Proteobacteria bacterium]|nr:3-phosphoshikimate 1-carboxyvinyltransferase [Pseudomonadota bacterium]
MPDHAALPARPLTARAGRALTGVIVAPGDKSISHRSLMLGGLAVGETRIHGLLEGEDVMRTAAAMRALGAEVVREADGTWRVHGRGIGGLAEPGDVIDLGNSGTGARLLMGLVATSPITVFMTGDPSLRGRPMARVATPLGLFGARFVSRDGGRMPLAVIGARSPVPIVYRLPVASAQVKSAVLLAGLNTPGETSVIEAEPTRDHTELMLRHFGVDMRLDKLDDGATQVTVVGQPEITGRVVRVPGDPSSIAFPLVAALTVPGSAVTIQNVGLNPRRIGLIDTLREMGADIAVSAARVEAGEPVGDIVARAGRLSGVEVPRSRVPSMIDEFPILAVAASVARGRTVMRGLAELRVKESDRLAAVARGLQACGVKTETAGDDLTVHGVDGPPPGGGMIETNLDHRIAMAFLVMGLAARAPVTIDDAQPIDTSFPGFVALMRQLGANMAMSPAT